MKPFQRVVFPVLGLAVFAGAFLAGLGARSVGAQDTSNNQDSPDAAVDENATLPPEIRSRLAAAAPGAAAQDFRPAVTFWEVLGKVKTRYVDKITDQDKLTHGAVASMLRSLRDPYSRVITPDELKLDRSEAAGQFDGMGVILGARLSGDQAPVKIGDTTTAAPGPPRREPDSPDRVWQLVVVDSVPGSPAAKAGLQTGDVISKINGVRIDRPPLSSKTIDDLNLMLNGPAVHTVALTILRPSTNQTLDINLAGGAPVTEPAVESRMLSHGAAYLRIRLFTTTTANEVKDALSHLAPSHPTALILDLRDNPGGSLTAAEQVVETLAPGSPAGLLDVRTGVEKLTAAPATTTAAAAALPAQHLAVLIDSGTASAAELAAAALREHKGAVLAGAPTFGNGLVQTIFPLADGWAYSLTTGRLRTPAGADFNEHGLAVDRAIGPDILGSDAAIQAAMPDQLALK